MSKLTIDQPKGRINISKEGEVVAYWEGEAAPITIDKKLALLLRAVTKASASMSIDEEVGALIAAEKE